jgi:hypothetical protein
MVLIIALVLAGLYLISSILHLIFTAKKKNNITKVTNFIPIPLLIAATILFLVTTFPDSKNLIRYYSCALGTTFLCYCFYLYNVIKSKNGNNIINNILFLISNIFWLGILLPSFKLCPVPTFVIVIFIILCIALILLHYFYCTKKFMIIDFSLLFLVLSSEAVLLFAAILTIISQIAIYSVMYFVGTVLLIFITCRQQKLYFSEETKTIHFSTSLLFSIYLLIMSASTVLMQI